MKLTQKQLQKIINEEVTKLDKLREGWVSGEQFKLSDGDIDYHAIIDSLISMLDVSAAIQMAEDGNNTRAQHLVKQLKDSINNLISYCQAKAVG